MLMKSLQILNDLGYDVGYGKERIKDDQRH